MRLKYFEMPYFFRYTNPSQFKNHVGQLTDVSVQCTSENGDFTTEVALIDLLLSILLSLFHVLRAMYIIKIESLSQIQLFTECTFIQELLTLLW